MQWKKLYTASVTLLALTSLYKYFILFVSYLFVEKYPIFPWSQSDSVQRSESPLAWLALHLTLALTNTVLSAIVVFNPNIINKSKLFKKFYQMIYYLFSFGVLANIYHFGQAPPKIAIILNGIPLLIMFYSWIKEKHFLYFFALTTPVVFELLLYLHSLFISTFPVISILIARTLLSDY